MPAPLVMNSLHERSSAFRSQVINAKSEEAEKPHKTTKNPVFSIQRDEENGV
jgi:hypothetical protein